MLPYVRITYTGVIEVDQTQTDGSISFHTPDIFLLWQFYSCCYFYQFHFCDFWVLKSHPFYKMHRTCHFHGYATPRNVSHLSQDWNLNLVDMIKVFMVKITLKIPQEGTTLENEIIFHKSSLMGTLELSMSVGVSRTPAQYRSHQSHVITEHLK